MLGLLEDKRNEFKIKLTDTLEKEVIAFLNTDGGNIFIGIDDKGNINGRKKIYSNYYSKRCRKTILFKRNGDDSR